MFAIVSIVAAVSVVIVVTVVAGVVTVDVIVVWHITQSGHFFSSLFKWHCGIGGDVNDMECHIVPLLRRLRSVSSVEKNR